MYKRSDYQLRLPQQYIYPHPPPPPPKKEAKREMSGSETNFFRHTGVYGQQLFELWFYFCQLCVLNL